VLLVERVTYESFENFERLLAVAVLEDEAFLVGEDARALLELPMTQREVFTPRLQIDPDLLDDALEEALFLDQETVSQRSQEQFDKAIAQLEHYITDQTLLLKRRRAALVDRIGRAEEARDAAVGSAARTRAEQTLKDLEAELDVVESEYQRLSERRDERFEHWSARAHARRFAEPRRERLFCAEIELT